MVAAGVTLRQRVFKDDGEPKGLCLGRGLADGGLGVMMSRIFRKPYGLCQPLCQGMVLRLPIGLAVGGRLRATWSSFWPDRATRSNDGGPEIPVGSRHVPMKARRKQGG